MKLLVDERDMKFVLYEQLRTQELCKSPLYADFSRETFDMILEEAAKLAERAFYPSNKKGDEQGCRFENGQVKVPDAFHEPYRLYREGGWLAMSDSPEVGGQGLPVVLAHACIEMLGAANWALLMYAGLTHGAAHLLQKFGTPELQGLYMRNLFSGDLTGTMCLTEPGAGSDIGSLRTRAQRQPDGTFRISGQKMFISSGMHDLTENIIHMVLARIDGAPRGTRGISIFLVPRLRLNESGEQVDNDVACAGIEQKMGIHGSATCVLNFGENGGCTGYLMGEENKGMQIMFEMMNEARLYTSNTVFFLCALVQLRMAHSAPSRAGSEGEVQGFRAGSGDDEYNMPHVDGQAVIRMVRSHSASLPIALVTATRDPERMAKLKAYEPLWVIYKPITGDKLLAELNAILARRPRG